MKVSVLIPSYEARDALAALLESIERLDVEADEVEVLVRDDGSAQGTLAGLEASHPRVQWLVGGPNLGFAGSCNELARRARGEVLCCVNQDTILEPGFLREGLAVLDDHPEAAALNTNMIMPWVLSREAFDATPLDELPAYEYQLTAQGFARYVPVPPQVRPTSFLTGGGFFLRRSALDEGEELFDADIAMYCEDTELALRLEKKGSTILYAPRAVLYHQQAPKRGTAPGELVKLLRVTRNRFGVMARHHPPGRFLRAYPGFLWGIVAKMGYLGLGPAARSLAYLVGAGVALLFLLLLPYWLWRSLTA